MRRILYNIGYYGTMAFYWMKRKIDGHCFPTCPNEAMLWNPWDPAALKCSVCGRVFRGES